MKQATKYGSFCFSSVEKSEPISAYQVSASPMDAMVTTGMGSSNRLKRSPYRDPVMGPVSLPPSQVLMGGSHERRSLSAISLDEDTNYIADFHHPSPKITVETKAHHRGSSRPPSSLQESGLERPSNTSSTNQGVGGGGQASLPPTQPPPHHIQQQIPVKRIYL